MSTLCSRLSGFAGALMGVQRRDVRVKLLTETALLNQDVVGTLLMSKQIRLRTEQPAACQAVVASDLCKK